MQPFYKELLSNANTSRVNHCKITDKPNSINQYVAYMLDRTNTMFEYKGLPDTIPAYLLETYLQTLGYAVFIQIDKSDFVTITGPAKITIESGLYIFYGGIGGEHDLYYRPKLFTAANPHLKKSLQCTILYPDNPEPYPENKCIIIPNDTNHMGLLPLFHRYAQELTENDISIRSAQINSRAQVAISTSTDRDKESAKVYLDRLEAGEIGILGTSNFLDSISVSNVSTQSANNIIQLIELQQYLKASWYNSLGLNVNFNMKREYMSEEEIAVNTDILLPLVDNMLDCRRRYIDFINKVFGTNITVEKSSAWANKEQEEISALAAEANSGGIPLKESIADKIPEGNSNAENVQPEIQEAAPILKTEGAKTETGEMADTANSDQAAVAPESDAINIDINIEVNGDESTQIDSESDETKEESEDDDTE